MREPDTLDEALRDVEAQVAWLEAQQAPRHVAESNARALLGKLIKRRQRAQQRGVPMLEGDQRGALRMVVLGLGCIALITGAFGFDGTFGGAAIVVSMGVLVMEGMR